MIDDSDSLDDASAGEDKEEAVPVQKDSHNDLEDEPQFEQPLASPNVTGEEGPSGSASDSESMDIDKELANVGLKTEQTGEED